MPVGRGFAGSDVERAQFQQLILDGIKGKLTSITSLPMNFIKGPLIGWNAPKAMVSSMGALTMPQLVISAAIGGGGTDVLEPSGTTEAGNLIVSPEECERAAEKLLGEQPPRTAELPAGLAGREGPLVGRRLAPIWVRRTQSARQPSTRPSLRLA